MKAGFCVNFLKPDNIEQGLAKLSGLGYDGVEIWQQYFEDKSSDVGKLRSLLDEYSLKPAQICPYFDFTGGRKKAEESLKLAEKYVEIARQLDCGNIRVFTGKVGSMEASRQQWKECAESLGKLCGLDRDINFVLETHPGSMMDTSESTIKLISMAESGNLRVNLQVPLADGEDIFESARKLGRFTCHIHAHNWIRKGGADPWMWTGEDLTYLSEGDYDFCEFVMTLAGEGFDGFISIEHAGHGGRHDPMETAEKEIGFLKSVIARTGSNRNQRG